MRPHKTIAAIGLLLLLAACTAEQTDRYVAILEGKETATSQDIADVIAYVAGSEVVSAVIVAAPSSDVSSSEVSSSESIVARETFVEPVAVCVPVFRVVECPE